MSQPDLFIEKVTPFMATHTRKTNPPSSLHASGIAEKSSVRQRRMILNAFRAYGPMNADQCDKICDFPMGTTGRRLHEMTAFLRTTGDYLPTRRGGKGEVWEVIPEVSLNSAEK